MENLLFSYLLPFFYLATAFASSGVIRLLGGADKRELKPCEGSQPWHLGTTEIQINLQIGVPPICYKCRVKRLQNLCHNASGTNPLNLHFLKNTLFSYLHTISLSMMLKCTFIYCLFILSYSAKEKTSNFWAGWLCHAFHGWLPFPQAGWLRKHFKSIIIQLLYYLIYQENHHHLLISSIQGFLQHIMQSIQPFFFTFAPILSNCAHKSTKNQLHLYFLLNSLSCFIFFWHSQNLNACQNHIIDSLIHS